jgi:16S rRNA (uracil1498-N3)-methyltransferase
MNIVLAAKEEFIGNRLRLADRRAEHIVKILKNKEGDTVKVGQIDGPKGIGVITKIQLCYPFSVELDTALTEPTEPRPLIDLILALPRPIMLRRILSQVAALGVGTIFLINSNRVEKSFWQATVLEQDEYRDHLLRGLEQAVATRVPEVQMHPRFRPFVEDYFGPLAVLYAQRLLAHPGLPSIAEGGKKEQGRVVLAIGPEGGWVDYEVEKFKALGFCTFSLGTRILKVDTAVVAAHARLSCMLDLDGKNA